MVTFGERLKTIRNLKGITLDKLADDLQTTKATLSRYENNLREPKIDFLNKVSDYFDVSIDYLLGKTNNLNAKIYSSKIGNDNIEIEIDKKYPHDLSPEEVENLINELKEVGFAVDKLIEKAKNKNS